jgi:hypothetical protein
MSVKKRDTVGAEAPYQDQDRQAMVDRIRELEDEVTLLRLQIMFSAHNLEGGLTVVRINTTLRKQLADIGIDVDDLISVVPGTPRWDREFDAGYGGVEGDPFVAWTNTHVVFGVCYDGAEWLAKLPRNPDEDSEPQHFGGG